MQWDGVEKIKEKNPDFHEDFSINQSITYGFRTGPKNSYLGSGSEIVSYRLSYKRTHL
jgi:hypothetical protein